jgi:hypothetical protein
MESPILSDAFRRDFHPATRREPALTGKTGVPQPELDNHAPAVRRRQTKTEIQEIVKPKVKVRPTHNTRPLKGRSRAERGRPRLPVQPHVGHAGG